MDPIVFGDTESNFGLMIRDRNNHDNYAFIDFDYLEILIEKYQNLKQKISSYQKQEEQK